MNKISVNELLEQESKGISGLSRVTAGEIGNVFLSNADKVYMSTDNGETWEQVQDYSGMLQILSLDTHDQRLYIGTDAGLVVFDLHEKRTIQQVRGERLSHLRVNPWNPQEIYSIKGQKEVINSVDYAQTWVTLWNSPRAEKYAKNVSAGMFGTAKDTTLWLKSLGFDHEGNILLGSEKAELRRLSTDGSELEKIELFVDQIYGISKITRSINGKFFLRLSGHHKTPISLVTYDNGGTWSPWTTEVMHVGDFDVSGDGRALYMTSYKKFLRSIDGGETWSEAGVGANPAGAVESSLFALPAQICICKQCGPPNIASGKVVLFRSIKQGNVGSIVCEKGHPAWSPERNSFFTNIRVEDIDMIIDLAAQLESLTKRQ